MEWVRFRKRWGRVWDHNAVKPHCCLIRILGSVPHCQHALTLSLSRSLSTPSTPLQCFGGSFCNCCVLEMSWVVVSDYCRHRTSPRVFKSSWRTQEVLAALVLVLIRNASKIVSLLCLSLHQLTTKSIISALLHSLLTYLLKFTKIPHLICFGPIWNLKMLSFICFV